MKKLAPRAVAVVGVGAILPDAPDAKTFWKNCKQGRYSISETPSDRWSTELYWDPDPKVPDKSYSKIGGWVTDWEWEPLKWRLPIPPKVDASMDKTQKWAVAAARQALQDYGYPDRPLDGDRTAVILGNAMAGEQHYKTVLRISYPEYAEELERAESFSKLEPGVRGAILEELRTGIGQRLPEITEDTMPGELANIIAGRIASLFDFHGPNFVCDAACASAMAAIDAAVEGLEENDFDVVITGGIDANMSASTYIKFCKIGALSATGTRPYADGADGFVMGEGGVVFVLKRLEDAERDGDQIYAVIRGLAGSSDGRGKGITAPNPIGQRLAVERAWRNAGVTPNTATMIEGHGTSTRVGDVVEVASLTEVFQSYGFPRGSLPLGSIKSNIGHLKGAAGAAGMAKAIFALDERQLPPSLNFDQPNPNIDFARSPFYVNRELRPWDTRGDDLRRAGVSAFGFGGTNFHIVLEEYIPGRTTGKESRQVSVGDVPLADPSSGLAARSPLRGALLLGAESEGSVRSRLEEVRAQAAEGRAPEVSPPAAEALAAGERLAVDYEDAKELAAKAGRALSAFDAGQPAVWGALASQGVFRGRGTPGKVAFLYTGQGSQYVNMLRDLRRREPIVAEVFDEADAVMEPLLGRPLSELIFVDPSDELAVKQASTLLRQTAITQPAVLTVDIALTRLLGSFGIEPDMVMGHSLGEYGALVAAGTLDFGDALAAVSARGNEMTRVSVEDCGKMAAAFAPIAEIEHQLAQVEGYVVIANINSSQQAVIGGASEAVDEAVARMQTAGMEVRPIPVSHAFHTEIVAPAAAPLQRVLKRLDLRPPRIPIVANVSGEFYPSSPDCVPEIVEILGRQIASPVQFVKGLETLYEAGARVFVEVGPKKALQVFALDVLGSRGDTISVFTNHPKLPDEKAFNQALCGLYAAGHGTPAPVAETAPAVARPAVETAPPAAPPVVTQSPQPVPATPAAQLTQDQRLHEIGDLIAQAIAKGFELYGGGEAAPRPQRPVVVTGAALGLPGTEQVFDDGNVGRILAGAQLIGKIPPDLRQAQVHKNVTRLVKSERGEPRFESISEVGDVIKLAGRRRQFDLHEEFGYPEDRMAALDITTMLAIGAGLDALRDAGVPLVLHYRTTTTGSKLPDRWLLPEALWDDTGVIFASAFPGIDFFAEETRRYYGDRALRTRLEELQELSKAASGDAGVKAEIDRRVAAIQAELDQSGYTFDRRFLFRLLAMGHSQFAELIGARGPNTQINSACASTTQAVALAEDWIRQERCRRVLIVSADDATSDNLMEWIGAGFLASGAAATDEEVKDAAIPFDRRRHGMLIGMGAAAILVESAEAAEERGVRPITELLSAETANSAFHGTRLNIEHIREVMERLVARAERQWGIDRHQIAPETVFVSHETYTPARGGSAQAEVDALRSVFGDSADRIVVANTKGVTGHPMGVGIEDVVAIKALETGLVPPVANFREVDPDLGRLNLSTGGDYPVRYALRLGAGFGSQISLSLMRWAPTPDGRRPTPDALGYGYRIADRAAWSNWLSQISGRPDAEVEIDHRTLRVKDPLAYTRDESASRATAATEAPAPAPDQAPVPAAPTTPVVDPIQEKVLEIVAEKTGYPPEMLDLDLDLEADLGIDTVKQAETFAAIRGEWDIPRDDNLALRDYPTLAHAIEFVYTKRPDLERPSAAAAPVAAPVAAPAAAPVAAPATAPADPVQEKVLAIVAEKTGYPPEMLDLDLDLEADLGIDTVKQAETFAAIRGEWDIPRDDNLALRDYPTLAHAIEFVYTKRPDLERPSAVAAAEAAPVAVPAATPAAAPAAAPEPVAASDPVLDKVLEIVSEKTGYPPEMLELDLDMEADLGIDTVKQAETFAAIRGEWDIPRDDNLALRDYPTLKHAIEFVYAKRPDLERPSAAPVPEATPAAAPEPVATAASESDAVQQKVLEIVSEKTGYPPEMLELDLDMEADLGIDTVKQAETFAAIRGEWDIPRDDNLALRDYPTLKHAIEFVYAKRPDLKAGAAPAEATATTEPVEAVQEAPAAMPATGAYRRVPIPVLRPPIDLCVETGVALKSGARVVVCADQGGVAKALGKLLEGRGVEVLSLDESEPEAAEKQLRTWLEEGPVSGVYWLPALDRAPELTEMSDSDWDREVGRRAGLLYTTLRTLYDSLGEPGSFLVAGTRLGGQHGYGDDGAWAPLGGAVTGLTKTFKRERPEALVKAVDFAPSRKTKALAKRLIAETLTDPGAVEIGYRDDHRWTVSLLEQDAVSASDGLELNGDSVFVVTGAAGSIVSAIVSDLAEASGGTFHLLDLAPTPDPNDPDLQRFVHDRDALKLDLFERIRESGERATPAKVERLLADLERRQAAQAAIDAIERAGGKARYHSVDMLDAEAVAGVVEQIRSDHDRVDVLLHAAGLEVSRMLPDKEPSEFARVFNVKAKGWFHLLRALGDVPLGAVVAFSSIAGRFGNAGQADYASANDLLCKLCSSFRHSRPETRTLAIDWTAWGEIGMATRGSIPQMMEMAGIDMLPPSIGVPLIRRELVAGGPSRELVIGQRLGVLMDEWHPTGGLQLEAINGRGGGLLTGDVRSMGLYTGLVVESRLDPVEQPFLRDHEIDETPVLPGVIGLEAFAQAAGLVFPDFQFTGVEDVQFHAPFKFYRRQPRTVTVQVQFRTDGDELVAGCRLLGARTLPTSPDPITTEHFTARVRLAPEPPAASQHAWPEVVDGPHVEADDVYQIYFHGESYQVVEKAWSSNGEAVGLLPLKLPPGHAPAELPIVTSPRLTELVFQTAGLWALGRDGSFGLPTAIDRVRVLGLAPPENGRLCAVVRRGQEPGHFDALVVDESGAVHVELEGYRTVELPMQLNDDLLERVRAAMR